MRLMFTRRHMLALSALAVAVPARANALPPALQEAMTAFSGGTTWRQGRVTLDIAPLVENGNAVPVMVRVQSAMTPADHVRAIAVFTERNPQPDVAVFHLVPHAGKAEVATRMRLATTQHVWALARMGDESVWAQRVEVIVTLASCIEGD